MTAAERQKRYRDKKRREREAQPAVKRGRKRAERGGREGRCRRHLASGAGDAVRLGRAWCEALSVTQGEGDGKPLRLLEWERAFLRAVEAGSAAGGRTDRDRDQRLWHGSASKRPPAAGEWSIRSGGCGQDNACGGRGRAAFAPRCSRLDRHAVGLAGSWRPAGRGRLRAIWLW